MVAASGLTTLVLAWPIAGLLGARVMPSYLAAWLFAAGLPLGALPVLLLVEWGGFVGGRM